MRVDWAIGGAMALALTTAACGPGPLPDLGFGSQSGTGETVGASEVGDGDGPTTLASEDTFASEGSESPGSESSGDGDPSTSTTSTTSTTSSTTAMTTGNGDGDGDNSGDGDGDWTDSDSWGEPPDVTNEPCEPLAQDCFPTHKCVPFATQPNSTFLDANKCMPILGDKQWGEACTLSSHHEGQDDCAGDGFCWNLDWNQGELEGTCVPFCLGTPQNLFCPVGWGSLFTGVVALCPHRCEPLLQDCPTDYGCYWTGNNFQCLLTSTQLPANHACDKVSDCMPGLACVDKAAIPGCIGDDAGCCTPWCELGAPDCPMALECVAFFEPGEVPDWLADTGACIAP